MAERARLHPLPCMSLTQGSLVKPKSNIGASNTAGPQPPPTHTVLVQLFPSSRTRKWKAQTKGPLATPSQVTWSTRSPYVPPMEARSVLVQEVKNSHLGARMRRKTIMPRWQLIQACYQIIKVPRHLLHHLHHHHHKYPTDKQVAKQV